MRQIVSADIGGTHARFALAEIADGAVVSLDEPVTLRTADHASFQLAWQEFGRRAGIDLPDELAIAFAGPVDVRKDSLRLDVDDTGQRSDVRWCGDVVALHQAHTGKTRNRRDHAADRTGKAEPRDVDGSERRLDQLLLPARRHQRFLGQQRGKILGADRRRHQQKRHGKAQIRIGPPRPRTRYSHHPAHAKPHTARTIHRHSLARCCRFGTAGEFAELSLTTG